MPKRSWSFIQSLQINHCLLKKKWTYRGHQRRVPWIKLHPSSPTRGHQSLLSLLAPHIDSEGWPRPLSALDTGLPGPGAGTHKWKPALSPLLASYLLWINKGSSPRLSGQFPGTHAHFMGHQSLHSCPKDNFLWSPWQALPRGGNGINPEVIALQQPVFSPNAHIFQSSLDHISLWLKTTLQNRKESSSPGNKPQLTPTAAATKGVAFFA